LTHSTRLLLLRHGPTEWNLTGRFQGQTDVSLSDEGRDLCKIVAQNLADLPIDAAYASKLSRSIETAERVLAHHQLEPIQEPGLSELHLGALEGSNRVEAEAKYPEIMHAWRNNPSLVQMPDGESIVALQERVTGTIEQIVERHPGQTVLIVSHVFASLVYIAHAIRLPLDAFPHLWLDPLGLSRLDSFRGRARLKSLNERTTVPNTPIEWAVD